jgi:hypothetical protein
MIVILPSSSSTASGTMLLGVYGPYSFLENNSGRFYTIYSWNNYSPNLCCFTFSDSFRSPPLKHSERYEIVARTLGKKEMASFFSIFFH